MGFYSILDKLVEVLSTVEIIASLIISYTNCCYEYPLCLSQCI